MPSLQQNTAMLSSPRRRCSAMEILSSAERGRRLWRRVSFTTVSTGVLAGEFSEEGLSFLIARRYGETRTLLNLQPKCLP